MNTKSSLAAELCDKEYRDSYVASQIRIGLPFQIRSLRKSLGLSQPEFARRAGMSQPRISEIESPGARSLTLDTLLRLASAFDVALNVRFLSFSALADWSDALSLEKMAISPFDRDMAKLEERESRFLLIEPSATGASGSGHGTAEEARQVRGVASVALSEEMRGVSDILDSTGLLSQMASGGSNANQCNFIG